LLLIIMDPESIAALKQAFSAFDSDDESLVTPQLLGGLLGKLGLPPPPTDQLQAFINAVNSERRAALADRQSAPAVRGVVPSMGDASVRRNYLSPESLRSDLITPLAPHQEQAQTMWQVFENSANTFADNRLFGSRSETGEYQWQTYAQVHARTLNLGRGLVDVCPTSCSINININIIDKLTLSLKSTL
jgi:hypothetical protein